MPQHIDIADRLTTIGDHHRQVDQHRTPIMLWPPPGSGQAHRDRLCQADPIGQHPQQHSTHMRHHTRTVRGNPQIPRPRRKLHLRSAPSARDPVRFDTDSFPCRRGTFAYLHAAERPIRTIIANHPG
jgi:hypothetical protein